MMDCRELEAFIMAWEAGKQVGEDAIAAALAHGEGCVSCRGRYGALLSLVARDAASGGPILLGPPPGQGFFERILGRIEGRRAGFPQSRRWLALVAAATLFFLGLGFGSHLPQSTRGPSVSVLFVLDAPDATSVSLVGDFNQWNPSAQSLHRGAPNLPWELRVELPRGRMYSYEFVIDGRVWVPDPLAQTRVKDGFGGSSSLLRL